MALRIDLNGDKPGTVNFSAGKWPNSANIEIMVQRNQDGFYLSQLNQWSPETSWHVVSDLMVDNEYLTGKIGPWLTDSLLALGGNCKFLMQVRECDNPKVSDRGVVNIKGDVLPSSAVSTTIPTQIIAPSVELAAIPEIELAPILVTAPEIPVEMVTPPPVAQTKKSNKALISIVVIIILLLIATVVAYLLFNKNDSVAGNNSAPITGSCVLSQLNGSDELTLIQDCLKSKPSTEQILALIDDAKDENKCNIAQRLYANQSQQNAKIAVVYAKEYDNKFYQKNSCFTADRDTAIYWYETALALEPSNDVAKTRLAELKAQ